MQRTSGVPTSEECAFFWRELPHGRIGADGWSNVNLASPPHPRPSIPVGTEEPYFLCGSVRSGTTVLRLLLGHHPALTRCEEFDYVASALHAAGSRWPAVRKYKEELPHRLDVQLAELPYLPETDDFPTLARELLRLHARADGRRLVGATVHEHFDELLRIWPTARFLYLRRDPRDVARSCVEMGFAGNAWAGALFWQHAEEAWERVKRSVPESRRLELHFEDLVQDCTRELERICAFLGVPYDPRMLEIERDTTYRRPDPKQCRSWRDDAALEEISEVEARLGTRLAAGGYVPSGGARSAFGCLKRARLDLADRFGRVRFAWKRFGPKLWLAGVITRRLPLVGLRRSVQARLDEVRRRHLR